MAEVSTTELLVVKVGDDYIRFLDTDFEYCTMNKASVFSLGQVDELRKRCDEIKPEIEGLQLMKLVISEEPFSG